MVDLLQLLIAIMVNIQHITCQMVA